MENHFEPYLYIAIQYSKNSVKFANNFLNDAKAISPENPIIFQEQACILYGEKQYMSEPFICLPLFFNFQKLINFLTEH